MLSGQPTLEDIYGLIPAVDCKGLCQDSCGPIAMSVEEDRRVRERGFDIPALLDGVAALERGEEFYCPALVGGRCAVYDVRPAVCRLWGATESMPCPHGCTPADALTRHESHHLLRLTAEAGGGMADPALQVGPVDPGPEPGAGAEPDPPGQEDR